MIVLRHFIFLALIVLALASGLSEPLARNSARIIFFISAVMFFTDQRVLDLILRRKRLVLLMLAFIGWLVVSSINAGYMPTHDSSTYWFYFSYNMFLFIPIALFIDREKKIDWIFIALAVSLMLNNIVVEMEALADFERPVTFLRGAYMQSALLYVILLPTFLIIALRSTKTPIKIVCWILAQRIHLAQNPRRHALHARRVAARHRLLHPRPQKTFVDRTDLCVDCRRIHQPPPLDRRAR